MCDKEKYNKQYFGGEENVGRNRARGAQHKEIEDSLLHWFTQARYSNCTFILQDLSLSLSVSFPLVDLDLSCRIMLFTLNADMFTFTRILV